jgi:hypothetical protein
VYFSILLGIGIIYILILMRRYNIYYYYHDIGTRDPLLLRHFHFV